MKAFYFLCFLLLCYSSKAQFSNGYAPSKWNTLLTPGSNGSVNTTGAPNSITLIGSDGAEATNMDVDYTITALATGLFSFSWAYHTNDTDADPQYDIAGVLVNGTFTQLTNNTPGSINQTGNYSTSVTAGTVIGFRLRAVDNIFGNATFTISSFSSPGGTLPIKLLSFTGQKQKAIVELAWASSSEINFSHFIVERSGDAANFYSLLTLQAGSNNGQYHLVDKQPLSGTNFYRLKMVDSDGSTSYSKTITINMESVVVFAVSPNPASEHLTVRINAASAFNETLVITNMAGVTVARQNLSLSKGINYRKVKLSDLAKGIYIAQLQTSGFATRFIKQ
jgi:hypothetical protein